MGAAVTGDRLEILPVEEEMRLVAGGTPSETEKKGYIKQLESNPRSAKMFGAALEWMRESFATAYPGETRENRFTNDQWREAGYEDIARINELMGRESS